MWHVLWSPDPYAWLGQPIYAGEDEAAARAVFDAKLTEVNEARVRERLGKPEDDDAWIGTVAGQLVLIAPNHRPVHHAEWFPDAGSTRFREPIDLFEPFSGGPPEFPGGGDATAIVLPGRGVGPQWHRDYRYVSVPQFEVREERAEPFEALRAFRAAVNAEARSLLRAACRKTYAGETREAVRRRMREAFADRYRARSDGAQMNVWWCEDECFAVYRPMKAAVVMVVGRTPGLTVPEVGKPYACATLGLAVLDANAVAAGRVDVRV